MEPMADDANLFHSLSASNQISRDANDDVAKNARQLVEKTFRFTANDRKGNLAGQIKCVDWWRGGGFPGGGGGRSYGRGGGRGGGA